jgi:phosphonate transport system substrate-binding protein
VPVIKVQSIGNSVALYGSANPIQQEGTMLRKSGHSVFIGMLLPFFLGLLILFAGNAWGQATPKVLRVAMVPAEDMEEMIRAFDPARRYLERELGMKIETFRATDYTAVVEAMRVRKIDMAFFGPFSYVQAAKRANAKAIVAGSDGTGRLATYHSILVTHRESGLKNMEDVKAQSKRISVSFVDPASTSGHLIPRGAMEDLGIQVDRDFRSIVFAGGHDASVLAVKARKVDLGATWEGPFQRAIDKALVAPGEVAVIWKSPPIPRSPIAVRGDLDSVLVKRLQQAFLDMPQKDPEAMRQFEGRWERNRGYVVVTDKDYEYIRNLAIRLNMF